MAGLRSGSVKRLCVIATALAVSLILGSSVSEASTSSARLQVVEQLVDNATNPLGIDDPRPSLGWKLTAKVNGERQTAYRIRVGSDPGLLKRGTADVWDSGRVVSDESVGVPYGGPALEAQHRYYWTVEVWDAGGRSSGQSRPAWWEMALGTWQGAQWISPAGDLAWSDFTFDVDFTVKAAAAGVVLRAKDAANYYLWQINAVSTPGKVMLRPHVQVDGSFSTLAEIDLAPVVTPANAGDPHHLTVRAEGNVFTTSVDGHQVSQLTNDALSEGLVGFRSSSSGGVAERAAYDNLAVHGLDGSVLFSDDFSTAPDPSFPQTSVVDGKLEPTGDPTLVQRDPDAPMLRKEFGLDKRVASARAYVYGLGFYELHLNGKKVGDRVLTPASTPYGSRNLYDSYDVTSLVRKGGNAVGVWLGNGYGARYNQYGFRWLGPKQAIVLLDITYSDGSRRSVSSDDSWKWSSGPIVANDIYGGESYDARLAVTGWDSPGFDDSGWHAVKTVAAPSPVLAPNTAPPIRVAQTLRPVAVTQPQAGVRIYDLGQNIAGWVRLSVRGPAGATVTMRTAEELKDGQLDTFTNRNAAATDSYTLAGRGTESYEPRFTYHGFRYVEVTSGAAVVDGIEGRAIHADVRPTGSFESSSAMLNTIWRNNRWSILNNSMSLPTDTPVRDERTPPAMDVQAYRDASLREFAMNGFYAKYLGDLPPGTALPSDAVKSQQPDMAGGQVSLAWSLFEQYGDRATLASAYPLMKAFVDRNAREVPGFVWPASRGFGDWCPPDHGPEAQDGMGSPSAGDCFSEPSLVNTALSYQQAVDVAKAAAVVGSPAEVEHYSALAASIASAFNSAFLTADGTTYSGGRQVTSILPLALGLVPPDRVQPVGDQLVATILGKDNGHLDTGIFGTRYLVDALARIGRIDVAMTMLHQQTYPGFGFEIAHGATTSWEQWLYTSGMETHDHAMFAGINASLYTVLGGIKLTSPAYRTVTIAPQIPSSVDHVSTSIDTVRGLIASSWRKTRDGLELTVTIPVNTTATVVVPAGPGAHIHTSAHHVGGSTYSVGSGHWTFQMS